MASISREDKEAALAHLGTADAEIRAAVELLGGVVKAPRGKGPQSAAARNPLRPLRTKLGKALALVNDQRAALATLADLADPS